MTDLSLRAATDDTLIAIDGETTLGTIRVTPSADGEAFLAWDLDVSDVRTRARVLELAVVRAFEDLGQTRVVAHVDAEDLTNRRAASMAGLRKDGTVRRHDSPDQVLLVRLRTDPEPTSRDGFIAMLNANLPTKRAIAQGLLYDGHGRVLLCELTYKREWDLPGGVVDPGESPAAAIVRELREELAVDVVVRGLRTVNWLPSWRAWDDAVVFVFDLDPLATDVAMTYQPTEIVDVHWSDEAAVTERATAATQVLLASLRDHPDAPYREAGRPVL